MLSAPAVVCCAGCDIIGHFTDECPTCKEYVCGRSTCDCSCRPVMDEDAMRQVRLLLKWRPILKPILFPVFRVVNLGMDAILTPVVWALKWIAPQ